MNAYTNVEQSKKLAEVLPLCSADMCYIKHCTSNDPTWRFDGLPMVLGDIPLEEITSETLPCWSLNALLEILGDYTLRNISECYMVKAYGETSGWCDNPIDACYELILNLKEK